MLGFCNLSRIYSSKNFAKCNWWKSKICLVLRLSSQLYSDSKETQISSCQCPSLSKYLTNRYFKKKSPEKWHKSFLAETIKHGNAEILGYLFDCGANVGEIIGDNRDSLLHLAASYGHEDILNLLFEKGANVHARNIK